MQWHTKKLEHCIGEVNTKATKRFFCDFSFCDGEQAIKQRALYSVHNKCFITNVWRQSSSQLLSRCAGKRWSDRWWWRLRNWLLPARKCIRLIICFRFFFLFFLVFSPLVFAGLVSCGCKRLWKAQEKKSVRNTLDIFHFCRSTSITDLEKQQKAENCNRLW